MCLPNRLSSLSSHNNQQQKNRENDSNGGRNASSDYTAHFTTDDFSCMY